MNYILIVLSLLVGGSSLAVAQAAGGSSGGTPGASGTATTGSTGYAGGTLSTGHTISGTAGSGPNLGNPLGHATAGGDGDASSVTQAPTSHDNAVDTPAAKNATNSLSNTDTGILKK